MLDPTEYFSRNSTLDPPPAFVILNHTADIHRVINPLPRPLSPVRPRSSTCFAHSYHSSSSSSSSLSSSASPSQQQSPKPPKLPKPPNPSPSRRLLSDHAPTDTPGTTGNTTPPAITSATISTHLLGSQRHSKSTRDANAKSGGKGIRLLIHQQQRN